MKKAYKYYEITVSEDSHRVHINAVSQNGLWVN